MLIPLICNQCGGKLEVQETKIMRSGSLVVVMPNQEFQCPHCGTKYIEGMQMRKYQSTGVVVGSVSIGGSFSGNSIVIGNDNTVLSTSQNKQDEGSGKIVVGNGNVETSEPEPEAK